MASVVHSHATGIHPAAYVGLSAPDTTDVQDHILWIDITHYPDMRLMLWIAGISTWVPLAMLSAVDAGGNVLTRDLSWRDVDGGALLGDVRIDAGGFYVDLDDLPNPVIQHNGNRLRFKFDGNPGDIFGRFDGTDSYEMIPTATLAGQVMTAYGTYPEMEYRFQGLPATPPTPADMRIPPPPPAVADNCTQVRCGVSSQCVNHLASLNTNWAHWLGPLLSVVGTVAFAAVLANVIDPLFDVAAEGALAAYGATWATLRPYVLALTVSISGGFLPPLTPDMIEAIQQPLFCALSCEGDAVSPTPAQIATWRGAVAGLGVFIPGTLTQVLLDALLDFTPLQDWQVQAQQATPLSTCDEWSCS